MAWKDVMKNDIVSSFMKDWYEYLWDSISCCWDYKIDSSTIYWTMKTNSIISTVLRRMSARIWSGWIYLVDKNKENVEIENNRVAKEQLENAEYFFAIPNLYTYIYKSLYNLFGSWKIYTTASIYDWAWFSTPDAKANIIDSRALEIYVDKNTWQPVKYKWKWKFWKVIEIPSSQVIDYVVYIDPDNTLYWISPIESIIKDALIDESSASRQLMYFKNWSVPNAIVAINPEIVNTDDKLEMVKRKRNATFSWNNNSNKTLISNAISDVKTLHLTNQELQLIEQRLYADKKIWLVFGIDLRMLWYMKDSWSAFSDISFTTWLTNEQLNEYARFISDNMTETYNRFFWATGYSFMFRNEWYNDVQSEKQANIKEVEQWIISRNEYRRIWGQFPEVEDEYMNSYSQEKNLQKE